MFRRVGNSASGPGTGKTVPSPGQTSSDGPKAPALADVSGAPKPMRARRDYSKTTPPAGSAPQPNPFGPTARGM